MVFRIPMPKRMETGIPLNGMLSESDKTLAVENPASAVPADKPTPGRMEGLVGPGDLEDRFDFFSSLLDLGVVVVAVVDMDDRTMFFQRKCCAF